MSKWFSLWWYQYLFAPRASSDYPWREVVLCRMRDHPAGVVWINPYGYEPDMHCQGCGDDLG